MRYSANSLCGIPSVLCFSNSNPDSLSNYMDSLMLYSTLKNQAKKVSLSIKDPKTCNQNINLVQFDENKSVNLINN